MPIITTPDPPTKNMPDDEAPSHIQGTPRLADADFIYNGYSGDDVEQFHKDAVALVSEIKTKTHSTATKYFILGSYSTPQSDRDGPKDRLEGVYDLLQEEQLTTAFMLEELDPDNDNWANFYLKYRYALCGADYALFVVEDNDGGHELELGEAPLEHTFILKRDYRRGSIHKDIEYEKYDGMMATLFQVMDENDHLYTWRTPSELEETVKTLIKDTADYT